MPAAVLREVEVAHRGFGDKTGEDNFIVVSNW
jgi:hypothetical protein